MKFLDTEVFRERSVISLPNTLMLSKLFLKRDLKLVLFVWQLLGRAIIARKQLQRQAKAHDCGPRKLIYKNRYGELDLAAQARACQTLAQS